MDSSNFPQGSDECSSSESGWTAYIASSDHEDDRDDDQDRCKVKEEEEDDDDKEANSDDSMASDASSGPSYQYGGHPFNKHPGFGHAKNNNGRKEAGKKEQKQDDKRRCAEKIKEAKHMVDRATRSKKK